MADTYELNYKIRNQNWENPYRKIQVHASQEEIERFGKEGYLIRESLFSAGHVLRLKNALDELSEREVGTVGISKAAAFGGLFLRHLMDKHPVFLELFDFPPLLSVARAMLGPQVQVLPMTARVAYPDQPNQETHWHIHQRVIPDPIPAFFSQPHVIDCLIYLDELNDANGPVCLVPGTHLRKHEDLAPNRFDEMPGQVTVRAPAGTCVMIHGNLWHRAMPTCPDGAVRRALILPYAASWLKLPSYGEKPKGGLMQSLHEGADQATREMLGIAEGLY